MTDQGKTELGDKIVSSEDEELILVDGSDQETGHLCKAKCHDGEGLLHRAFSIFLFNASGELLLQQRGESKRLWPGFWSNTCCSHPRKGESTNFATERRMQEELGVTAKLEYVYKFQYQARFGEYGAEHELCSVFLGRCEHQISPNANEIAATRLVSSETLDKELHSRPDAFTPWMHQEWEHLKSEHAAVLGRYCGQG